MSLFPKILDLCGGTGSWSQPYRDAGYDVEIIDMKRGQDVRRIAMRSDVHGVLAAPPCTDLSGSGARWWRMKGDSALTEALSIADACLRIITLSQPSTLR